MQRCHSPTPPSPFARTAPRSARGLLRALVAALTVALVGCSRPLPASVEITCKALAPVGDTGTQVTPDEPLDLVVVFDSVAAPEGGVRLRVDALDDPGVVAFTAPPRTAAAAGMTVEVPARYHGCATLAAFGIELRAAGAPRGKAWVRVSTDRTVRMRVRAGPRTLEPVLASPGESALASWGTAE